MVLESSTLLEGVPAVEGLEVGDASVGDSLSKGKERLFKELTELKEDMEKFELSSDRIVCDGKQIYT